MIEKSWDVTPVSVFCLSRIRNIAAVIQPRLVQVYLVHEAFGEKELEEILASVRDNKELVKSSTFWSMNQIKDPSFVTTITSPLLK